VLRQAIAERHGRDPCKAYGVPADDIRGIVDAEIVP
jgi:hypothetical protein